MTACTLVTSHIGPQCSSRGLEWSNAQVVVWNGQMVSIITALCHFHDIYGCMHTCRITHCAPMLKRWSGMVRWSISSLCFAIFMIYDCMHPCHITHWSPMLKWWPGMVKWSVSSLLFAISMIYDCMHPRHITTLSHHKLVPNWSPTLEYDCVM